LRWRRVKGFILASQLLWIERFLKEYLGYCNGDIVAKISINLPILASSRKVQRELFTASIGSSVIVSDICDCRVGLMAGADLSMLARAELA
jgi:hypothetical protein